MIEPAELPELLTSEDVGKILGRHPRTILNLVAAGELRAIRLGRRTIRFDQRDVADYVNRHKTR